MKTLIKNSLEFTQAKKKLNQSQLKAVETIDGPVLTLAGPGTGKTQVLTLRIGEILSQTQMNPSNILCLTFTEAAALEMRQRLISFIGHNAYDVKITTFHGFANSIIQEFSHKFGHKSHEESEDEDSILSDLTQIDSLDRLKIISQIIEQENWKHLRPFKKPLLYLNNLARVISDIKRERIDPDKLRRDCQNAIDEIGEDSKKQATLINKLERTIELSRFFKYYQQKLAQLFLYDYEDMINWVVDKLQTDQELSLIYQEKYQYILVDEYQDTNNSQLELIKTLTSHFSENPNLFVVGDPNQSIYRFQGASNKNIDNFLTLYPKALKIDLTENYRSPQLILDTAHQLIQNNDQTNLTNPNLHSNSKYAGELTLTTYLNTDQEAALVAQEIGKLIKNGVKANSIAILLRQNRQIDHFVRSLDELNIPTQITSGESVLTNPIINKVLAIFELLLDPYNKDVFSKAIYFLRSEIGLEAAYELNRAGPKRIFSENGPTAKDSYKIGSKSIKLIKKITTLSEEISLKPAAQALQEIIQEFNILKQIGQSPERILDLEALKTLVNNSKRLKTLTPKEWFNRLTLQKSYNLDLLSEPILYGQEEAVIIQTYHQSKGREYDYVFLPALEEKKWGKGRSDIFYLPIKVKDKTIIEMDEIAEQRRVLYVGITRTIKNCYLSVAKTEGQDALLPSRLIEEIKDKAIQKDVEENVAQTIESVEKSILPLNNINYDEKEIAWLKQLVAQKPLTPTGYGAYLSCPKNYLLTNILRLPAIKSPSLSYGTAIHFALEQFFNQYKLNNKVPPPSVLLINFEKSLNEEILTKTDRETQLEKGLKLLTNYYEKFQDSFIPPIRTEYSFPVTYLGDIPIKGKIDKIEWLNEKEGIVAITDYKTGNVKSRNALMGLTKAKDTNYYNQLKFYNVLAQTNQNFKLNWKIGENRLDFIDEKFKFTRETFTFTQSEIDDFKKDIQTVWAKMQNLEFEHIDGSTYGCEYCDIIDIL